MSDSAAQRRAKQSVKNLIWAILATLGVVLLVIFAVPRDDSSRLNPVDALEVANAARESSGLNVIQLYGLPEGWYAARANWSEQTDKGEAEFFVGLVGPDNQYLGITQVFEYETNWFETETLGLEKTNEYNFGKNNWSVFEPSGSVGVEDKEPAWVLFPGKDIVFVTGSADSSAVELIISEIDSQFGVDPKK